MVGIGIIGAGNMGYQHIRYLSENENVSKIGVFDINTEHAKKLADEFGATQYDTLEDMLCSKEIDGVFIITPPKTHAELTEKAFAFHKHVSSMLTGAALWLPVY